MIKTLFIWSLFSFLVKKCIQASTDNKYTIFTNISIAKIGIFSEVTVRIRILNSSKAIYETKRARLRDFKKIVPLFLGCVRDFI